MILNFRFTTIIAKSLDVCGNNKNTILIIVDLTLIYSYKTHNLKRQVQYSLAGKELFRNNLYSFMAFYLG